MNWPTPAVLTLVQGDERRAGGVGGGVVPRLGQGDAHRGPVLVPGQGQVAAGGHEDEVAVRRSPAFGPS